MSKKFLASVAAAALFAGSASALGLTMGDADGVGSGTLEADTTTFPAAGQYHNARVIAEEATLAAAGSTTGLFELTVTATGTFAAAENYFVDVTVTGGEFSQNLTGAEVTSGSVTVTGASVQATPPGGSAGDDTVRFLVSTGPAAANSFGLELPITVDGCSDMSVSVSVQTTGGVTFEEGIAALATPAISCGNAYQASISTDVAGGVNDSVLASSAFTNYVTSTTAPGTDLTASGTLTGATNDTMTVGTHGVISVTWNPDGESTASTNGSGNVGLLTNVNTGTVVTGAAGELDSVDFDVAVGTSTGLAGASLRAAPATVTAFTAGEASLSDTGPAAVTFTTNPYIENILLTVTGAAQITQQSVDTNDGVLEFDSSFPLVDNEPIADASIDDLNFEGVTCGVFDWVGDSSKPTQNIFRVTGHGSATTSVVATVTNSNEGINGAETLDGSNYDFTNAEVVVTAAQITDAIGLFGRGDVLLNFIGAQTSLDCDRLMNSDNANIITAFGNNNTQTYASHDGVTPGSAGEVVTTVSTDGDD